MSREEILEKLNEIFQDMFDDEDLEITEETVADDVEGWDSLMHISLIEEVEDAFDIRFTMVEVNGIHNVGALVSIIADRM